MAHTIREITTARQRRDLGIRRFVIEDGDVKHTVIVEAQTNEQLLADGPPIWKTRSALNRDTADALARLVCQLLTQPLCKELDPAS